MYLTAPLHFFFFNAGLNPLILSLLMHFKSVSRFESIVGENNILRLHKSMLVSFPGVISHFGFTGIRVWVTNEES